MLVAALTWAFVDRLSEGDSTASAKNSESPPVPVMVGPVERGPITLRRTFSGTLEASAEFVAAPKIGGRLQRLGVDLGDTVQRGQIIAWLDDAELVQAVHQAEAELAVAKANFTEAENGFEIAERYMQRAEKLSQDGVTSDSQLDEARAQLLASEARVAVRKASITRAEAALESVRIRRSYASVQADWVEGNDERIVARRLVDEGGMVSPNSALFSIVDLDPLVAVLEVPERDYAHLAIGLRATLTTDGHPGRVFDGQVARIAPVFRSSTRQARVELLVPNADLALKPGMFVRATLELERIEETLIIPFDAPTKRAGVMGVFVLDPAGEVVHWRPVETGVRDGERVQVHGEDLGTMVVTLGQELCDEGARVRVAHSGSTDESSAAPSPSDPR